MRYPPFKRLKRGRTRPIVNINEANPLHKMQLILLHLSNGPPDCLYFCLETARCTFYESHWLKTKLLFHYIVLSLLLGVARTFDEVVNLTTKLVCFFKSLINNFFLSSLLESHTRMKTPESYCQS